MTVFSAAILLITSCKKESDDDTPPVNWPSDSIRTVKTGLNFPWEILWGSDDHIWMTERGGKISKIDPLTGNTVFSTSIADVAAKGEGGLLGMVQHPDFKNNGYLYVAYNYNSGSTYLEKIVRLQFKDNALSAPLVLLENIPASNIHNGARLWITSGGEPKLFVTTGDANNQPSAQDINSLSGKVLRINLDGSIPADNPIAGNPYWSSGHRNAQGLVVANNIVYATEHGPNVEDELNIIEKAGNYGWPSVTGLCNGGEASFCATNNVRSPLWSSGGSTVATSGLDYYNKDLIAPWKNSLLMTTLKDATLYQFKLNADGRSIASTTEYFNGRWGRLRDLCISPQGRVYLCTSNGSNQDVLVEISNPD
ncbi:MAG: PQQ-dependent sugar dehydrogenase [Chitinophagaceae bacterium]|nr:PQQ-dependent sugar dehydrogenase [Chitinophagaceae bacterium]